MGNFVNLYFYEVVPKNKEGSFCIEKENLFSIGSIFIGTIICYFANR